MDRRDFIKSGLLAASCRSRGCNERPESHCARSRETSSAGTACQGYSELQSADAIPPNGTDVNVSALGFGMLRLPMKNGHVDFDQTTPMVRRAIEGGVNYIDTGRVYLAEKANRRWAKPLQEAGATGYMSPQKCRGGRCNQRTTLRSSSTSRAASSARTSSTSTTST